HREITGQLLGGQDRGNREAAAQALGAGEDVRHHVVVHVGEQVAGTANPSLHFVEDQQRIMLVAQLAYTFQVGLLGRTNPTFALDRLQHYGTGLVGNGRFQRRQVIERDVGDALWLGPEAIGVLRLASHAHGKEGATVEAVERRDNFVLLRTEAVMGNAASKLEGGLVSLGAGVA